MDARQDPADPPNVHGGALIRPDIEIVLRDIFVRNFPSYQHVMRETWEQKLEREIWRRSLRGRWFYLQMRIGHIRRRIALLIAPELDDSDDD